MSRYNRKVNLTVPRLLAILLLGLVAAIQYPLWKGKGSVANLAELRAQVDEQKRINKALEEELDRLSAEAESLRGGEQAMESRARSRLNIIKEHEVLIRLKP